MKRMFVDHAGRVQVVEVKAGESASRARFWGLVVAMTVSCFVACCVAAGLI